MIEKALLDRGLNLSDDYEAASKSAIAAVSIEILTGFLALASESEGDFSQSFNIEGLKMKIDSISKANGLSSPLATNIIRDKSNIW